jgi:cephalosporin hydroxylase
MKYIYPEYGKAFDAFQEEKTHAISAMYENKEFIDLSRNFVREALRQRYTYNFSFMGVPTIQFPEDLIQIGELIYQTRPQYIIECGVAYGGSLLYYSAMQKMFGDGEVIGIDIEIRKHNHYNIENHPMADRVTLIESSSTSPQAIKAVEDIIGEERRVMVILDSMHTEENVLKELELYSSFVGKGMYIVVCDGCIEFMPPNSYPDRPWDIGNNPYTAANKFLAVKPRFRRDSEIEKKNLITCNQGGYLVAVE